MDDGSGKSLPAYGFLTVLESAEHGLFGGYLVLSPLGRPLEFRCSTPIAPSRAQEILYGPTLRPYLFAEVIGQSLVSGSELPVVAILTDQRDVLPLGALRGAVVLHVAPAVNATEPCGANELDFAGCRICAGAGPTLSLAEVEALLAPLAARVDLCEPFGRIIAALAEAQLASSELEPSAADERPAAA
jgi:hypothetical protein